ncbi:MAG TPA: hypothetical protein VJ765_10925, partial [Chitinophagaceae bacterium]|nr:hypothetical protein [Chitinophagaceae bacterium]
MEVHHHPIAIGSNTSRKKWTHYFWEFFMLFLAVTLGFFVENQREHYIEHKREKAYIRSLVEDLKKDTANIRFSILRRDKTCKRIDSVVLLLKSKSPVTVSRRIYYLARQIPYSGGPRLGISTKTFDQLKSSGNLRLIRKMQILDMISDYYYDAATMNWALDMSFQNQHDLFLSVHKLFDAGTFQQMMDPVNPLIIHEPVVNPPLLTTDAIVINEICTRFHFTKGTHQVIMRDYEELGHKAIELMQALQKEYHLK